MGDVALLGQSTRFTPEDRKGRVAEEYALADGPVRAGFFGESLLGPTLIAFGTEQQQARFLPPILRGEDYWCQGFSEPGAARTWPRSRPVRSWTAMRGTSTGRRCGRAKRSLPTGSSPSAAPKGTRSGTTA